MTEFAGGHAGHGRRPGAPSEADTMSLPPGGGGHGGTESEALSNSGAFVLNVGAASLGSPGWEHAASRPHSLAVNGQNDAASLDASSSRPSLSSSLPHVSPPLPRTLANDSVVQSSPDDGLSPFVVTASEQQRAGRGSRGSHGVRSKGSGSQRRLFSLLKLGGSGIAHEQLFYGLRVRMGVAAGLLPPGVDVRGSAVFELAKGENPLPGLPRARAAGSPAPRSRVALFCFSLPSLDPPLTPPRPRPRPSRV
jgi:hypothetical protein